MKRDDGKGDVFSHDSVDQVTNVKYDARNRCVERNVNGAPTFFYWDNWSLIEKYTYDIFGTPTILDSQSSILSASAFGNRFLFTGREYIAEIGLYDYRNRFYSGDIGRFLSKDLIGFLGGDLNLFSYVGNNHLNMWDPFGIIDIFIYGAWNKGRNPGTVGNADLAKIAKARKAGVPFPREMKDEMLKAIKAAKEKCPDEKVDTIGYSRGAIAANDLTWKSRTKL